MSDDILRTRTILVVDDEKSFRKKYKWMLRDEGFRVFEAPNALEVANVLMKEATNLDLILLDINLPEVDGRDIFDIIGEYAPQISILVTSVHPLQDQKIRLPKATDYFHKSQSDDVLIKKVKKILGVEKVQA